MKDIQLRKLYTDTDQYVGKQLMIRGWIRTNRSSNKFGFIELNDGSYFKSVQIVYEEELIDNFEQISKAPISAALCVTGDMVLTPGAKQPFEIKAKQVVVEAGSDADYPLQKKKAQLGVLKRNRPFAAKKQYVLGGIPGEVPGGLCHPSVFFRKIILSMCIRRLSLAAMPRGRERCSG